MKSMLVWCDSLQNSMDSIVLNSFGKFRLNRSYNRILESINSPVEAQNILWKKIRLSLEGTRIYKDLKLDEVNSYEQYLEKISPRSYSHYSSYIESVKQGQADVLFKGKPAAFIMTSGTTGFNDKLIPYNNQLLCDFQKFQTRMLGIAAHATQGRASLSSFKVAFGANPVAGELNGVPKGYVSGLLATRAPQMVRKLTLPSQATLQLENWSEKVDSFVGEAGNKDVRMIAAVPAHLVNLFGGVLSRTAKGSVSEVWPNLEVVLYSGTGIEPYERALNELAGKKLKYIGMYLSSEAPIGFEFAAESSAGMREMVFAVDDVLLSFAEVDNPAQRLLGVHELQEGVDYLVYTGTSNGLLQYAMNDVIRVVRTRPYVSFVVQGRHNQLLNIATEKVSMQQLSQTISDVEKSLGTTISHFFVHPEQPDCGQARYKWHIASENPCDPDILAKKLDEMLMRYSGDYKEERLVAEHIGAPRVNVLSPSVVREYFRKNQSRGQFKMKNVFTSDVEFEEFARKALANF